jgi:cytochrome c oxidase subunit 2
LISICSLLLFSTPSQAVDGKALFASCSACHGNNGEGNPQIGAPNIAGMDSWYLERQLTNFTTGLRGTAKGDNFGAQMRAAVSVLKTDSDRNTVAKFIASLPKKKSTVLVKADLTNGSTQFNAVCSSCHGSHGRGNEALGAPNLLGTDPVYLERQILAFRNNLRGNQKDDKWGLQMRVGAGMLPDDKSARDVVAYIGTLKQ